MHNQGSFPQAKVFSRSWNFSVKKNFSPSKFYIHTILKILGKLFNSSSPDRSKNPYVITQKRFFNFGFV